MSNEADKSTAMHIVLSGGFLWFNPIAISVVIWSKTVLVRSRWIYLLILGRIRDPSTFAALQRSEIGRYEVSTEVSLPGLGIGMINEDFHIARI